MSNSLGQSASPYLLQHRDNPVDWLQWGAEAFERAGAEDKPILLSIGYAACHWCHVMAHESFENQATARLMNENFVCVKVDREERPDLDQVYQSAIAALDGQGGWPLTMFLLPDGAPFWGGTYFPPIARWGRPGFPEILTRIAEIYRDNPDKVREGARELSAAITALSQPDSGLAPELSPGFLDRAAEALLPQFDVTHGGLRGAPKFPQLSSLELMWRAYLRGGNTASGDAVLLSLNRMCQGGIYDHVGGGFARYTIDEAWLIPHFEKMLYDNAQFIALLTHVWRKTRSPLFAARVYETVAWALNDLTNEAGAFVSSFDADSEGVEGRYTVWTADEIDSLLGQESSQFKKAYGVIPEGNWEGSNILNRSGRPAFGSEEDEDRLARARAILLGSRRTRIPPMRDDKVLTDWNGLMIAALTEAGMAFDEFEWISAAERAFTSVLAAQNDNARLFHSSCNGSAIELGFLDDYAAMARAALTLHEATGNGAYFDHARNWLGEINTRYRDQERGGYFYTATDGDERLLVRPRHARDAAQPSGNALVSETLARLYWLGGGDSVRAAAHSVFGAFAGDAVRHPVALAALLNAYDLFASAVQITVIGVRGEPSTDALLRAAFELPTMNRVLRVIAASEALPVTHPAAGKKQVGGMATAYLCVGPVCASPITTATELADAWEIVR